MVVDIASNEAPVAVSFDSGNEGFEVLFGPSGRIVQLNKDGRIIGERILGPWADSMILQTAARLPSGWLASAQDSHRNLFLMPESDDGGGTVLRSFRYADFARSLPDTFVRISAGVTRWGDRIVASLWWNPYETLVMDTKGEVQQRFMPSPEGLVPQGISDSSLFLALPALPLDRGFLQTYVDLRSDRRILVLFDSDGSERRRTTLTVPIGYVASLPASKQLLAIRRVVGTEVVVYEWQWR
jgi:hypothetical protein